jgi:hypothetical protein
VVGGGGASGGGVSYDADALDYFTRAEALGGSFDLSGISGTYTASYVKTSISDFVAGCKADSIWTKLKEVYLLSGVTFGGMLAKLKYVSTATLTNVNFVSGDLLAAGSGAGLVGNDSTKYLNTSISPASAGMTTTSGSLSWYATGIGSIQSDFGCVTSNSDRLTITAYGSSGAQPGRILVDFYDFSQRMTVPNGTYTNSISTISRVGTEVKYYKNGSSTTTKAGATPTVPAINCYLFAINNSGSPSGYSGDRLSFAHLGTGLTDAESLLLSNRVNALMTAIGANVY